MNSRTPRAILAALLVTILAGTACRPDIPTPPPTPAATPTPLPPKLDLPYTPVPPSTLSPVIIQRSPEPGERLQPAGAIELVFDRAMDQPSVEAGFKVQPQVAGAFTWTSARAVVFKPSQPLPRNTVVDVALTQNARASDGAVLREPFQFRFVTQGNLEVGQTIPASGAQDIDPDTIVTVLFNRPVVPLTTLSNGADTTGAVREPPLSFDPPIAGRAEWLNTSVLVFRPARPLPGGATFTGRIAADLKDTDGNPLAGEYTWSFSTAAPKVISVSPDANSGRKARIDAIITVQFNQDVEAATAQTAFALLDPQGTAAPGQFSILSDTLTFTPANRLAFDTAYTVRVAAGVKSASGGIGSPETWNSTFTSVPLPRVIDTQPANGEQAAYPGTPFVIHFNTEIDPATVMEHVSFTPPLSLSQVYTYYNAYDSSFVVYFDSQPATDYNVEISPGIADPYGNRTAEALQVSFHTRDLDPSASLAVPGVATLNAYLPARLVATTVNISSLDLLLLAVDTTGGQFLSSNQDQVSALAHKIVRQWRYTIPPAADGRRNQISHSIVDLAADGGKLAPGAYWLTVTSPDIPTDRFEQRALLIVSEVNLTLKSEPSGALAWATDLQTGQPVPNLPIQFYTVRYDNGVEVEAGGAGTTDAGGVAQTALSRSNTGYGETLAVAGGRFAAISSSWANGIGVYDFNIPFPRSYSYYGDESTGLRAYIYTDRPIYRPGQQVFLRGIVRAEDDVKYSAPPAGLAVQLRVNDPRGQSVFDKLVSADEYGSFNGLVNLAADAPLGQYTIMAETSSRTLYYAQFTVSAYRPPEYEATVTPGSAELARGSTLSATIAANYLSGGALRNASVQWNVMAYTSFFSPPQPDLERYTFSDSDDPWRCWECWHYPSNVQTIQPLFMGFGATDERGQLHLSLPISTELSNSGNQLPSGTLTLSIEANVTGADNQIIAGRASVTVHPADFYIGIAFDEYLIKANQPATVSLIAVDWKGARLSGQAIDVEVYRREWKNHYDEAKGSWTFETSDELITGTNTTVTSDARGEAVLTFTPPQAGTYRVVARGRDSAGRIAQSSRFIWATGSDYVPWMRENNDRVNLIANKTTFLPGETAEILIPSPFGVPHYALVTVERGHIIQHEVISITSSSQVYRLPLPAHFAPNVYVSVVLFAGASLPSSSAGEAGGEGRPDFKVGYVNLEVLPVKQVISITLTPDRKLAQPGQPIDYTLQATDNDGKPVVGQFSLDLVDKGILNLMPRESDAIVGAFYGQRGPRVQTAAGLSISANRVTEELQKQALASGIAMNGARDLGGGAPAATAAAEAPKAADAYSTATSAPQIRENFADTAFWSPGITTDAEGKASVTIKLPDNLTTWVLRAVGVDSSTRVGEGTVNVVATKPLLIRPVTPRFLVAGDVIELGAVVNNNTDTPQTAVVALSEATGLTLTTPVSQEVTIPAQGEVTVNWTATVAQSDSVTQVDLVFSVANDQYSDASRPRLSTAPNGGLKVNRYSAPEVVGTAGELDAAGSRTEIVGLPPRLDTTQGSLTLRLDPSLVASMQAGLTYLENYPYDSADAVLSRFLPNVLTYRALSEFSLADAALKSKLEALVRDSLDKLYQFQHSDGGWGWWQDSDSSPHISAYIVFGMVKAREAGFSVDGERLNRAVQYLQGTLRDTQTLRVYYELNQQAYVLYVLGEAGQFDAARVSELFDARDKLSLYARALVALTIGRHDKQDARLKTLFADLNGRVVQSATGAHWEEQYTDWWAMNTDTRSTAIILSALAQYDPGNKLAPNVVRWLMMLRQDGIWHTSQETAWSLIALTDWVRTSGELKADFEFGALLNDKTVAQGRAVSAQRTLTQTTLVDVPIANLLRDAGNRLTIVRGDGPGRLYYTAHLKAYLPVPAVKAADRGIQVLRRYTLASCSEGVKCPEITSAKVGDVIRVELTLIAPNELYYVQLEDPIPAGTEIVDTALATTSQLAQGPSLTRSSKTSPYWWWWYWYSRSEVRDDRIALFAQHLSQGTYEYSYTIRASMAGQFNVIPTFANEQYFPEVFGRSDGALFTIEGNAR